MSDIFDDELFKPPGTFMGLDYGHDLDSRRAAVLGIPFDNGTHPHRVGARDGPRAIREASLLIRHPRAIHRSGHRFRLRLPTGWAEGLARLCTMSRPSNVSEVRWRQTVDAAGHFVDHWAGKASALGWSELVSRGLRTKS